jgi:hypothetical protein
MWLTLEKANETSAQKCMDKKIPFCCNRSTKSNQPQKILNFFDSTYMQINTYMYIHNSVDLVRAAIGEGYQERDSMFLFLPWAQMNNYLLSELS